MEKPSTVFNIRERTLELYRTIWSKLEKIYFNLLLLEEGFRFEGDVVLRPDVLLCPFTWVMSLRALINCNNCDDYDDKEGRYFSIVLWCRLWWLLRNGRCQVFWIFILHPATLEFLVPFKTILLMCFSRWQCPLRKTTMTRSLCQLSSSMVFALGLLKFPRNTLKCLKSRRNSQRDAMSFCSLYPLSDICSLLNYQ